MTSFNSSTVSTELSHIHCDIINKTVVHIANTQRTYLVMPGLKQIQLKMALYFWDIVCFVMVAG